MFETCKIFICSLLMAFPFSSQSQEYRGDLSDIYNRIKELLNKNRNITSYSNEKLPSSQLLRSLHYLDLSLSYEKENDYLAFQYLSRLKFSRNNRLLNEIVNLYEARIVMNMGYFNQAVELLKNYQSKNGRLMVQSKEILLKSYWNLRRYTKFVHAYEQYQNLVPFHRMNIDFVVKAAKSYKFAGNIEAYYNALELASSGYPLSQTSRTAVQHLVDLSCSNSNYKYSLEFLKKISINASIDPGLAHWVESLIDSPLRIGRTIRLANFSERLKVLKKVRDDSVINRWLDKNEDNKVKSIARKIVSAKLRNYSRKNSFEASGNLLRNYFENYGRSRKDAPLIERYGRLLMFNQRFGLANYQFQLAGNLGRKRTSRWLYFLSLYHQKNYELAMEVLESAIPLDRPKNAAKLFWKAEIYRSMNMMNKAVESIKKLLKLHGSSYYSVLVSQRFSEVIEPHMRTNERRPTESLIENKKSANPYEEDVVIRLTKALLGKGLYREARDQFLELGKSFFRRRRNYFDLKELFWRLNDFRLSRVIVSHPFSKLKNQPNSLRELINHQSVYRKDWKIHYPLAFEKTVEIAARLSGVNKHLIWSIMRAESFYNPDAISPVGAQGIMQIMPYTGIKIARLIGDRDFSEETLRSPESNILYGTIYLKYLSEYYKNPILAVAAYNAGPDAVNRWLSGCKNCDIFEFIEMIPYRETRRYVKKVIRYHDQYARIYNNDKKLRIGVKYDVPDSRIGIF